MATSRGYKYVMTGKHPGDLLTSQLAISSLQEDDLPKDIGPTIGSSKQTAKEVVLKISLAWTRVNTRDINTTHGYL